MQARFWHKSTIRFLKMIVNLIPITRLPKATAMIHHSSGNIEYKELPNSQKRDNMANLALHRIDLFLETYSLIRFLGRSIKKMRRDKQFNKLYSLIGEITLLHAGTEQGLKSIIVNDFCFSSNPQKCNQSLHISADTIRHWAGDRLSKSFIKELKYQCFPIETEKSFIELIKKFQKLSKRRNQALKTIYEITDDGREIKQKNILYTSEDFYKDIESAEKGKKRAYSYSSEDFNHTLVTIADLSNLKNEIQNITHDISKLLSEIYHMKIALKGTFSIDGSLRDIDFKNPFFSYYLTTGKRLQLSNEINNVKKP